MQPGVPMISNHRALRGGGLSACTMYTLRPGRSLSHNIASGTVADIFVLPSDVSILRRDRARCVST